MLWHLLHIRSEIVDLQAVFIGYNSVLGGSCITAENNAILIYYTCDGSTCFLDFRSVKAFFDQESISVQNK